MSEFIEDRLDKLEAQAARQNGDDVPLNSIFAQLRKITERLRFIEAWHDDHEKRLASHRKRLDDIEDTLSEITKQIGTLQEAQIKTLGRLDIFSKQIGELDRAVLRAQCGPSKANSRGGPWELTDDKCGHPTCGQCYPPKRLFKGGWLNVYAIDNSTIRVGVTIYFTKAEADKAADARVDVRLACLKIPDYTEGEGL